MLLGIAQSNYVLEALSASCIALASGFDGFSLLPLGLERAPVTLQRRSLVLIARALGVDSPGVLHGLLQDFGATRAAFGAGWGAAPDGRQDLDRPNGGGGREDPAKDSDPKTPAQ